VSGSLFNVQPLDVAVEPWALNLEPIPLARKDGLTMAIKDREKLIKSYRTKRCPNCNTNLAVTAIRCDGCGRTVGEVNEHGIAKKPFDWKGYLMAVIAVGAFCVFVWWAFLRT
jgi:hypothetical protein